MNDNLSTTALKKTTVTLQLEKLASLKDGWLDGIGLAPSLDKLQHLAYMFDANFDANLPLPRIYPTPGGGVQVEWSIGVWEVTLEIDLVTEVGEYQALNLSNDQCHEHQLALDTVDGWKMLNDLLVLY